MKAVWLSTTCLLLALGAGAHANIIDSSPTGIASPAVTITFDEHVLATDTSVTNQYADLGATFSPNVFYSPQTNFGHVQGNDVGNYTSNVAEGPIDPVTLSFSTTQNGAAFSFDADNTPYRFDALLGGVVVDTFSATVFVSNNDFFGFTGDTFDSIKITRTDAGQGPFWVLDNIQLGSTTSAVPEPASLGWTSGVLIGIVLALRKRAGRASLRSSNSNSAAG
jgi:hypothetical protein